MLIGGCDPGAKGGIAIRDTVSAAMWIFAMPTYKLQVGRHIRETVDELGLIDFFRMWADNGLSMLALEKVGSVPGQGAQTGFVFGAGVGAVRTAAKAFGVRVEEVQPVAWKGFCKAPRDKAASRQRASEMFPDHRHLWPLAKDDGKAEAAMIAFYAEKRLTL